MATGLVVLLNDKAFGAGGNPNSIRFMKGGDVLISFSFEESSGLYIET